MRPPFVWAHFFVFSEGQKKVRIFASEEPIHAITMEITYNAEEERFDFDFLHDGQNDIISLTGSGYNIEAFGQCFYYGYEFADQVDGSLRSAFIKYLKFSESIQKDSNLTQFLQKAVNDLGRKIDLYHYDLIVMPESSSRVNQYLLRYLYRFAQPSLHYMELVKSLPSRITSHTTTPADEKLYASIHDQNILVVDDVTTSGSTLNEVLRALRTLNDSNNITIFSILGRKDLMAEA